MKRILLNSGAAEGNANPPALPTGTPPQAAEVVATGKSEREAQLERENAKLKNAVKHTAAQKRKVEVTNAYLADENQRLKQNPQPQPEKKKSSWGFFD